MSKISCRLAASVLKVLDVKMTDKENCGSGLDWKNDDKVLANCEHNYRFTGMISHLQLSVFHTSGATAALRTSVIITNYCWHIAYKECCNLVDRKRQEFAMEGSTEYRAIPKSRGFVYAYDSQLYRQVKKVGRVRYLKCTIEHCDGSAKLDNVWPRSV